VVIRPTRLLAAIGVGYIASLSLYSKLPGPYLTTPHPLPAARLLIALVLPTAAAAISALLRHLWLCDPIRRADPEFETTYRAIVFRIVVFMIAIHLLVVADLAGVEIVRAFAGRAVLVLTGLTLVGVGDLLPRTRPNIVFGIRTPRTLADRRVWMETHRVGGYVAVGLGLVIALSGAFLPGTMMPLVVGPTGLLAGSVLVASYRRSSHA
jgi:uncharacterized membrane protein